MIFTGVQDLTNFIRFMEGLGYKSSISTKEVKQEIKNLKSFIQRYHIEFDTMENVAVLYLVNKDDIVEKEIIFNYRR